jgi:L-seryl-tRNA(Ser) seleniumtransferase
MAPEVLRNIPSVNELLESQPLKTLTTQVARSVVVTRIRDFLDNLREEAKQATSDLPLPAELAERIASWIVSSEQSPLRPVINATGVLLHTGLGRAPMASEALTEMHALASGYCSLEVDLETGERSQRHVAVQQLLQELTGAEAALVVNNNAGATLLTLAALASGQEVIVSRGELVEIGGSYRLPDVMTTSGASLREVGTTNKTRIQDYADAIGESTAALLKVHTSNYAIVGFTEQTKLADLVRLAAKHRCLVIDDIGSGALIDYARFGLNGEPVARASIEAGADVVLFSGDKLLGGPQCGIIVGRRSTVETIRKHPLSRALRVDKLTLGALAATLKLYRDPELAQESVPLLALLSTSLENLRLRAENMAPQLEALDSVTSAEILEDETFLGGGSLPTQRVATWCVSLQPEGRNVNDLARALRTGNPSIFGRVQQDRLLLDLRTVFPRQDTQIIQALESLTVPETDSDGAEA